MTPHPLRQRRRAIVMFICILATAAFTGPRASNAQGDQASAQRGRQLAERLCTECHTLLPRGGSPNAAAPPFRTLMEKLTLEGIEDELSEGILLGHKPMPQWQFSFQEVYDLSSFIASVAE